MTSGILFLGYGYTARALGRCLRAQKHPIKISATARTDETEKLLRCDTITPVPWKNNQLPPEALDDVDCLLISTPPGSDGCPAFLATQQQLIESKKPFRWIGYLSSNGVYGDHDGAWVGEENEPRPQTPRGKRRLNAEATWRDLANEHDLPLVIFRLPGIYGPGRSALDTVRAGTAKRIHKPGQVFSRAHVDDIAQTLFASLQAPKAGNLFNVADDEPAPPQDVITFACQLLGVEAPPILSLDDPSLSEMAKSFYRENKRVSNAQMKEALGVDLRYPTYREGLTAILNNENH